MWHECAIEKNFYRSVCDECFCSYEAAQQWVCFALIGAHFISDEGSTNPLILYSQTAASSYILTLEGYFAARIYKQNMQSQASPHQIFRQICAASSLNIKKGETTSFYADPEKLHEIPQLPFSSSAVPNFVDNKIIFHAPDLPVIIREKQELLSLLIFLLHFFSFRLLTLY